MLNTNPAQTPAAKAPHLRVVPTLHLIGCSWDSPFSATVYLSADPTSVGAVDWDREATCIAYVRVSHDSAPGYCAEAVELADVDGDASGLDAWLAAHADELLSHWGRR